MVHFFFPQFTCGQELFFGGVIIIIMTMCSKSIKLQKLELETIQCATDTDSNSVYLIMSQVIFRRGLMVCDRVS